ncbi:hypothetical protein [Noviherbaspirillum agri]
MHTGDKQAKQAGALADPQGDTGKLQASPAGGSPASAPDTDRKEAGRSGVQQDGQQDGQPHVSPHGTPHVTHISREEAERTLAPDPDPDDPVSP